MLFIVITPLASVACGMSQLDPVACFVTCTLVELRIDERLGKHNTVTMDLLPVRIQPGGAQLHHSGRQVRHFGRLHAQQKTAVGNQ